MQPFPRNVKPFFEFFLNSFESLSQDLLNMKNDKVLWVQVSVFEES
jgi:hypothetical protein